MRRFALLMALGAALTACGGSGSADGGGTADGGGAPAADTPEARSARCAPASSVLVSAIESGLTVNGGGSLSNAYIVRSDDFENVHFVAAQIEGEGMGDSAGVWATNGPDGTGSIFAADSMATEFSDWGSGPGFTSSDDGLAEARECAER